MTDFIVKVSVKNGRLLRAIRKKYGTSAEMSRASGVSQQVLSGFLTMRFSPLTVCGEWSKAAFDVSSALHMEPEDIWPAHIAKLKLRRNEAEMDVNMDDLQDLLSGATARKAIAKWSKGVSPRHMRSLLMMADGATLEDAGKSIGVSKERLRQMAMTAARKIRSNAKRDKCESVEDFRK
jgi:lambda repressor-like predicted transcriptional regulator